MRSFARIHSIFFYSGHALKQFYEQDAVPQATSNKRGKRPSRSGMLSSAVTSIIASASASVFSEYVR